MTGERFLPNRMYVGPLLRLRQFASVRGLMPSMNAVSRESMRKMESESLGTIRYLLATGTAAIAACILARRRSHRMRYAHPRFLTCGNRRKPIRASREPTCSGLLALPSPSRGLVHRTWRGEALFPRGSLLRRHGRRHLHPVVSASRRRKRQSTRPQTA